MMTLTRGYIRHLWCQKSLRVILVVLMGLILCGCKGKQTNINKKSLSGNKPSQKLAATAKVKDLQLRLDNLLSPIAYHYDSAGKPDPFQPFLKSYFNLKAYKAKRAKKPGPKKRTINCTSPLACMDLGQLTLVAVISESNGTRIAMAQDAAGKGYILTEGTRIGFRNGKVIQILPDKVVVAEEGEDLRGRPITIKRALLLHPEE